MDSDKSAWPVRNFRGLFARSHSHLGFSSNILGATAALE